MAIKIIKEPAPPRGSLGRPELFALSIGQVIGAGVITLIVPAVIMTGYSAWLAYIVAIVMGFLIVCPNVFVTSTVRLGGGNYSLLCDLAGPAWSGVFAFATLTQAISLSLFGTAAAAYIGDLVPALSSAGGKAFTGVALLTIFYVINISGISLMAKAQKLMTWMLIAALMIYAIVGICNISLPIFDFSNIDFMPNGMLNFDTDGLISNGFFAAVMLFVYSAQGYSTVASFGRDAKNARRDIPFVILAAVPTLIIIYVSVAIATVGSTSLAEFGDSTSLVIAAQKLLPGPFFYLFIICGPVMALLSTMNATFAFQSITIGQSCSDGWLPKKFGDLNKKGSRVYILTFLYVVGIIPILLGFSISTITNQIQLVGSAITFMCFFAFVQLPKKYPEAWKNSRFHIPDPAYYTVLCVSLVMNLIIFWKSCLSITTSIFVFSIVTLAVCACLGIFRSKKGEITIRTSVWDEEPKD